MDGLTFATWMLIVASFGMSAVAWVGLYQAMFVFPEYFSAPPASLRRYQNDKSWKFWLPLHVITLPAIILSLTSNWSNDRFELVLIATILYTLSWIATFAIFIPGVIEFNKVDVDGPPSEELAIKGRKWLRRSTVRLALMLSAAGLLVVALGM
jgi:hypothetical protein